MIQNYANCNMELMLFIFQDLVELMQQQLIFRTSKNQIQQYFDMKPQSRQNSPRSVLCRQHKDKYVFVCLHKTCALAFKIGCIRCRKDHAQHPNRLLSLNDFHALLGKPITYLQTESAFKLLNLKKKVEYIRNFRTEILQKEMELMASNRGIKATVTAIREQHYLIRDVMSHIDPEGLNNNFEQYLNCLQQSKQFMTYNPIKGDITFNNQVIKTSRVQLEKHLQKSQELIDHIRQFLVKIIEVLLAHCTHDEDDEDIEFAEEGSNPTDFNIIIKNRTDASQHPNIKNKIEHRDFLEIFDEQKEAMSKQVQMLEKELDDKNTILHKIKSAHSMMASQICEKSQDDEKQKNWLSKTAMQSLKFKNTYSKQKIDELRQTEDIQHLKELQTESQRGIRSEYEAIISMRNKQIEELKNMCNTFEDKVSILTIANENSSQFEKMTLEELQKERRLSYNLTKTIKQMQSKINSLNDGIAKMTNQQKSLIAKMTATESQFQKRFIEQEIQKSEWKNKKEDADNNVRELKVKFDIMLDELAVKQKQVQLQLIKCANLQNMLVNVKEENSKYQLKLEEQEIDFINRQQGLKSELKIVRDEMENVGVKLQQFEAKNKLLQNTIQQYETKNKLLQNTNQQFEVKNKLLQNTIRQFEEKNNLLQNKIQQQIKTIQDKEVCLQTTQKNLRRQLSQRLKLSSPKQRTKEVQVDTKNSKQSLKGVQQQAKKYKQTKGLLEMSIKKNQELKDRNNALEQELQSIKVSCQQQQQQQKQKISKFTDKKKTVNPLHWQSQKKKFQTLMEEEQQNDKSFTSESIANPTPNGEPLGERHIFNNKAEKKQAYLEIKHIFKAVTEDMTMLEERLKQNTVIEKVYLKELERKRNENKILKKELQNFKIYGTSKEAYRLGSQTSLIENKDRLDLGSSSQLNHISKESQFLQAKRYTKANVK